jgi:hypothetical protein
MGWTAYQILMLPILPSLLGALCVAMARPGTTAQPEATPAVTLPRA